MPLLLFFFVYAHAYVYMIPLFYGLSSGTLTKVFPTSLYAVFFTLDKKEKMGHNIGVDFWTLPGSRGLVKR